MSVIFSWCTYMASFQAMNKANTEDIFWLNLPAIIKSSANNLKHSVKTITNISFYSLTPSLFLMRKEKMSLGVRLSFLLCRSQLRSHSLSHTSIDAIIRFSTSVVLFWPSLLPSCRDSDRPKHHKSIQRRYTRIIVPRPCCTTPGREGAGLCSSSSREISTYSGPVIIWRWLAKSSRRRWL